MLNGYTQYEL